MDLTITESLDNYIAISNEIKQINAEKAKLLADKAKLEAEVCKYLLTKKTEGLSFDGIIYKGHLVKLQNSITNKKKISVSADELLSSGMSRLTIDQLFDNKNKDVKVKEKLLVKPTNSG